MQLQNTMEAAMVLLASSYDQSKYLKAVDLKAEKKFRIKTVTEEMIGMDKDKEKKLVVWFTNDERGLVLNRVNNRVIREAFGDDVAGWTGKIIAVYPTTAEFRGKMTEAMRVRIPPSKQSPTAAPASPQPTPSGNGAAVAPKPATEDPDLAPDPVKPVAEELDDDIPF